MKNSLLSALFVCAFLRINAQPDANVEKGLFKINALIPGVSYEFGLGKNTTLNLDALLIPYGRGGSNRPTELGILPGFQSDFRYFANMNRRLLKGKNISGNSGNYISVSNQFYALNSIIGNTDSSSNFVNVTAIAYGIQRTRPKGFYWGISFGPGVGFDQRDIEPVLFIDARLGWVVSGRK